MSGGIRHSSSMSSLSSMDKGQDDMTLSALHHLYSRQRNMNGSQGASVTNKPPRTPKLEEKEKFRVPEGGRIERDEDRKVRTPTIQKKRRKRRHLITANLAGTRYEVVRQVIEDLGFGIARDDDPNSYLFWNDAFVSTERISDLKSYQKINHFPGMGEVTRKDNLARNMLKMSKVNSEEINFVPRTWILPSDHSLLQNYHKDLKARKKNKTFIIKPANGAQGHGISLFKNPEKITPSEHFIVQEYVDKPLLLDGYKFDLRIYVLVTSCDPLRIFLFNDGLVRMSTEKYLSPSESNLSHLFMHLTNYSVNKHNEYYEKGTSNDTGSKRSIKAFNEHLRRNDLDVALLWRNISDMIVKTLIVAEPHVLHAYRMCRPGALPGSDSVCFEILGFDVLIDWKLKPWLLEINRSPSFGTDENIDYEIKSALLEDAIRLLNIKLSDKRKNIAAQKAEAQKRLFRPTKRVAETTDTTELERKRQSIEKRKEELKDTLARVKKAAAREEFENRNSGRFRRIFPVDDKVRMDRYINLMTQAFNTFMSARGNSMQKEIQLMYGNKIKEDDILDMLAECEMDEQQGRLYGGGAKIPRGPKNPTPSKTQSPLQSMPVIEPATKETDEEEDEEEDSDGTSPPGSPLVGHRGRPGSTVARVDSRLSNNDSNSGLNSRPNSALGPMTQRSAGRPQSTASNGRSKSLTRFGNSTEKLTGLQRSSVDDNFLTSVVKEREEELTRRTKQSLNDMRIKFPGKSDQEADIILDRLHENWKFHKPRIASYWLVKLDSIKRRKVVDIVKSNVRAVLQRTWRVSDVDNLRLSRIFSRVFNRLLWSHGQGLWNCFSSSGGAASWETIFSKSSENIAEDELDCCRRIVQLCKDCLLIVYQFASEAKNASHGVPSAVDNDHSNPQSCREIKSSLIPPNTQTLSQRYSKLYQQPRPESQVS